MSAMFVYFQLLSKQHIKLNNTSNCSKLAVILNFENVFYYRLFFKWIIDNFQLTSDFGTSSIPNLFLARV